jgi:hypothetical protein
MEDNDIITLDEYLKEANRMPEEMKLMLKMFGSSCEAMAQNRYEDHLERYKTKSARDAAIKAHNDMLDKGLKIGYNDGTNETISLGTNMHVGLMD